MMILKRRSEGRVRRTRFVPASVSGFDEVRLESRALTAPAFWRQPGSWAGDVFFSTDWTMANAGGSFSQPTDITRSETEFSSEASSVSSNVSPTGFTTLTITGLSTSDAEDVSQTFAPLAPVGVVGISVNTANTISVISTGAGEPVFNGFSTSSSVQRNYVLADDSSTPSATSIVQHASVAYVFGATSVTSMGGGAGGGSGTVRLNINASGGNAGITQAVINNNSVAVPSSGTFVDADGNSITYSASASGVEAFSTTALGALGTVGRDGIGNVVGVPWNVVTFSQLSTAVGAIVDNGTSTVVTHYDAHFA